MKRNRSYPQKRALKASCYVSAAALMLGVSHAATIGINFTVDYCGSTANYINYVNAPAFGVPTTSWENLTPMGTGYSACSGPLFYEMTEVIDTTSSTPPGGLNPLPNGSLTVNWSAPTANWSGFRGYNSKGANQPNPSSGPPVPEAEVYAGFLRDGVNFGPPGGADNTSGQAGYVVELVGLKSLFTNSPFVVQLIGASDSMQTLTNAFIIDATLNSTQSVVYPNTQIYGDAGGADWVRAIGGGLSTMSDPLNTDHLKIIGNKAEHGGDKVTGFDNASCIAGFIITDKPVVSMPPQSALAGPGDNVTMRTIAIGVPPLTIQWRKDGVPIALANGLTYAITNIAASQGGNYDVVVTNAYGSTTSKVAVLKVDQLSITPTPIASDSKPSGESHDSAIFGAKWLASSQDNAGTNRLGVMQFAATNAAQITISGKSTDFDSPQGTIMFWTRSSGTVASPGSQGATLFDRKAGNGLIIVQQDDGTLLVSPSGNSMNTFSSASTVFTNGNWHNVAIVYDQSDSATVDLYVDGVLDTSNPNAGAWSWTVGQEIELGLSHTASWKPYNGLLDDFRIYSSPLSADQIASIHSSDALADTTSLQVRLNFDTTPAAGATITWLSGATLQSADVVSGPYTDVTDAASPYTFKLQGTQKFYSYKHTAVSIVTNPYDM
jgi:hypothetical protein